MKAKEANKPLITSAARIPLRFLGRPTTFPLRPSSRGLTAGSSRLGAQIWIYRREEVKEKMQIDVSSFPLTDS